MASGALVKLNLVVPRQTNSLKPSQLQPHSHRPLLSLTIPKLSLSFTQSQGFGCAIGRQQCKEEERGGFVQTSAVREFNGSLTSAHGHRFAIVVARFNDLITKNLLEGALNTFKSYSVREEDIDVVWVPGSFEIGVVAQQLGKSGKYQSILCIGAVIRGDTSHYDAVVNAATSGVLSAGINSDFTPHSWSQPLLFAVPSLQGDSHYVTQILQNPYCASVDPIQFGCGTDHTGLGQSNLGALTKSMTFVLMGLCHTCSFLSIRTLH